MGEEALSGSPTRNDGHGTRVLIGRGLAARPGRRKERGWLQLNSDDAGRKP